MAGAARLARRSTALAAVRWAAATTLAALGVMAFATAAAGAPPPVPAAIPAACVETRTCACAYPPGAPADAPDAACTIRKCVTCTCSRGGACTTALVLTQVGTGDEVGDELPSTWGGPAPGGEGGGAATAPPSVPVTPTTMATASPTPKPAVSSPPVQGRGGGRVAGCLAPGTPCGFSPSAPACCDGRACVREGPFRMCEE